MSEYPDIQRGTRFSDTSARSWQNLTTDVRGPASIQSGPGILITQSGQHFNIRVADNILQLLLRKPRAATASETSLGVFRFRTMHDDYFDAYKLDADGEPLIDGDGERLVFKVAKPFDLRRSPFDGATIEWREDFEVRYEYFDPPKIRSATRLAHGDTPAERFIELIWKPYEAKEYIAGTSRPFLNYRIWAQKVGEAVTGLDGVSWLDLNVDARLWAER